MTQQHVDSVKRRLFCDEQLVDSPLDSNRSTTPLSYNHDNSTVFFMGFKFPQLSKYYCSQCFVWIAGSDETYTYPCGPEASDRLPNPEYTHTGEIALADFYKKREAFETCALCGTYLTIVRPYHSAHLDFE